MLDPPVAWMPFQSPVCAVVAVLSPLVSPPAVSSRQLVNTTGAVAVPATTRDPFTVRPLFWANLTIVPASIVSVAPALMARSPSTM